MSRLAAAALLLAAGAPFAGAPAAAGVGLSASPARVTLVGTARTAIRVRNPGSRPLRVDVSRARLALSLRGRPAVGSAHGIPRWFAVHPTRLRIAPGGVATLTVSAAPPRRAEPGDHAALVLLTTRPAAAARVRVRLRVGVEVVLHVPGRIVRRLRPLGLRVRRLGGERRLELRLANRGNVSELLGGARLRLVVLHGGRTVATLRPQPRELLPGGTGIAEFVYRGRLRGPVRLRVETRPRPHGRMLRRRTFRARF